MKFLVDAHLPRALALLLNAHGHDARHTRDLPASNATKDSEINRISIVDERIVASKDGDFYHSFTAQKEPFTLLHYRHGEHSQQGTS
jgi:predicted nuclease of predicted toxin-antitoxin system